MLVAGDSAEPREEAEVRQDDWQCVGPDPVVESDETWAPALVPPREFTDQQVIEREPLSVTQRASGGRSSRGLPCVAQRDGEDRVLRQHDLTSLTLRRFPVKQPDGWRLFSLSIRSQSKA